MADMDSHNDDDVWGDDDFGDGAQEGRLELEREWKKRHREFYTIGYREGLMEGKEKSAQEGFNEGFRESVMYGYNWGIARGITSAMSNLPDDLKEKLNENIEKRKEVEDIQKRIRSVSTKEALSLFHDDYLNKRQIQSLLSNKERLESENAALHTIVDNESKLGGFVSKLNIALSESSAFRDL